MRWTPLLPALIAGVLCWAALNTMSFSRDTLVIETSGRQPVPESITYAGPLPGMRERTGPVTPESVTPLYAAREVTLTVTPTGRLSGRRKGAEVWLLGVSSDADAVPPSTWVDMPLPSSWKLDGLALVNGVGASEAIEMRLLAGGYVDARLAKHRRSGGVRLQAGDASRTVDLRSKRVGSADVRLLLDVPASARRRITLALPSRATHVTLTFSGEPRTLQLERLERISGSPWSWTLGGIPGLVPHPGVILSSANRGSATVDLREAPGSISFTLPWVPRHSDTAMALFVALLAYNVATAASRRRARLKDSNAGRGSDPASPADISDTQTVTKGESVAPPARSPRAGTRLLILGVVVASQCAVFMLRPDHKTLQAHGERLDITGTTLPSFSAERLDRIALTAVRTMPVGDRVLMFPNSRRGGMGYYVIGYLLTAVRSYDLVDETQLTASKASAAMRRSKAQWVIVLDDSEAIATLTGESASAASALLHLEGGRLVVAASF